MVHIQGDKAKTSKDIYEIPAFKLAQGIIRKLAKESTLVNEETEPSLVNALKLLPHTRKIISGGMHPVIFTTILTIMDNAKLNLPEGLYADFKAAKFLGAIELKKKKDSALFVHAPNEKLSKKAAEVFFAQAQGINDYRFHILVTSQNELDNIPGGFLSGNMRAKSENLFDRSKYSDGTIGFNEGEQVPALVWKGQMSMEDSGLLTSVAESYSVSNQIATSANGLFAAAKSAFEKMERGEMPHRYKGMADSPA